MGVIALVPRLARAWQSIDDIIRRSTPDDAYYYFAIARNVVDGQGVSFDGEHVTNGFHPLWLIATLPCFVFSSELAVHLALSLGAILGAATAVTIFLTLHRNTASLSASLLGAGFFALHPAAVRDSVNGLESAIALFMLVLVLAYASEVPSAPSPRRVAVMGVLLGLLVLARTEMAAIGITVGLFLTWRWGMTGARRTALAATVAAVVVAPWLVWSALATGSVVQVSGEAGGVFQRQAYTEAHGSSFGTKALHGAHLVWDMVSGDLSHSYFLPGDVPGWRLALVVPPLVLALGAYCRARGQQHARFCVLYLAVLGAFLTMLAVHAGLRWFLRPWYFAPGAVFGALAVGLTVDAATHWARTGLVRAGDGLHRRWARVAVPAVCAAALVIVYQPYDASGWTGEQHWQLNQLVAARWLADNTEKSARVGSFNAGIFGFYSERTVVNLDGVVNEDAYRAVQHCAVTTYVARERLDYVVDLQGATFAAGCGPPVVSYELIATLGTRFDVFGGALVDVLKVTPAQPSASE